MAYIRGLFGALLILGFMVILPGVIFLTGEPLDEIAMAIVWVQLASLALGVIGGTMTYAIPITPRREFEIRRYCAELLGPSVDPARVIPDASALIVDYVNDICASQQDNRTRMLRDLIIVRANISKGRDISGMESITDDLLDKLAQIPQGNKGT